MIQIIHNDLDSIAELHYEACSKFITPRLNFYIDLFDSLGNKKHNNENPNLSQIYNLTNVSIQTIIDPFLKPEFKSQGHTRNVTIASIAAALFSDVNDIIKDEQNIEKYKGFHLFFHLIKTSLHKILTGNPTELNNLYQTGNYNIQNNQDIKEVLEKVFSYETLINGGFVLDNGNIWNNYSITQMLDISVCPYCNRNWINTVTEKIENDETIKVTSPQLDHFLSKSLFPLFRLSFFNLIPSCETCNARLKKGIEFSMDTHLHPYHEGYRQNAKFKITPQSLEASNGLSNNYDIELEFADCDDELKNRINENYRVFHIEDIYKMHGDIIADIYRDRQIYNTESFRILRNQYPYLLADEADLYRLAFGNYYYEEDFKKRPFAKLTRDVTEQLGILIPEN